MNYKKELELIRKNSEIVLDLTKDNQLSVKLQKLNNGIRRLTIKNDIEVLVIKKWNECAKV